MSDSVENVFQQKEFTRSVSCLRHIRCLTPALCHISSQRLEATTYEACPLIFLLFAIETDTVDQGKNEDMDVALKGLY